MAIFKNFTLVLAAVLSVSVYGQTNINYDRCGRTEDERDSANNSDFENDRDGSMRRTYGNLCTGSIEVGGTGTDTDISSRVGHPFRQLCDVIDRWPNVKALMSTGNSPHTIFAPTDAAFNKVAGLIDRVDQLRLLELHILPQGRLTRDLRCGQTYRTINTQQDRRNNQRSKTRCINARRSQQLGPGNIVNGLKPTIGSPDGVFRVDEFQAQDFFNININTNEADNSNNRETFSEDVISCNGVIHVVDEILLPGGNNAFATPYYGSPLQPGSYYGIPGGLNNYYTGQSHSHGSGHYYDTGHSHGGGGGGYSPGYPGYYGYYGKGYRPGRPSLPGWRNNGYYAKSAKKGKGAKGFKGAKYLPVAQAALPQAPLGPDYYGFRNLETDAEFFGTDKLVENEAKGAEEDLSNRKRRLEAMLEPNGDVAV